MKKLCKLSICAAVMILLLSALSAGCGPSYEIAMITYASAPQDDAYSAEVWRGIQEYAAENARAARYYTAQEQTVAACLAAVKKAVDGGARVVIFPGCVFEQALLSAQSEYPAVSFIIIDGNPNSISGASMADNACAALFSEQQAGFLAGYAAVRDGYTDLGFMGGVQTAGVIRYGYGFVAGAQQAASEMGILITLHYIYADSSAATPQVQAQAEAWYAEGVEVIFACGENLEYSVIAAAEKYEDAWVIGCDTDCSAESGRVLTSACKALSESVKYMLALYFGGAFPSGQCLTLGAAENAVMLPMDTSHFTAFIQDDYEKVYALLASDYSNTLPDEQSVLHVLKIPADNVKMILQ